MSSSQNHSPEFHLTRPSNGAFGVPGKSHHLSALQKYKINKRQNDILLKHYSEEQAQKINTFLSKTYSVRVGQQLKEDMAKGKDLLMMIMIREFKRSYKYPEAVSINYLCG